MVERNEPRWLDAREQGATGDGKTLDSPFIQRAIDICNARGGGIVYIPPGVYACGTIHAKSNVTLEIAAGACLCYSSREEDFDEPEELPYNPHADIETTYFKFALLHAENAVSISIRGGGKIDGRPFRRAGPKPIALKSCKDIDIRGIAIENAPNYCISLIDCDRVVIDGVKIHGGLADGIDLDNCRYCMITNSYIECFDDAVCLKTSPALGRLGKTTDIAVTNCCIGTSCYGLKIGTETSGDCRNVAFSNCTLFTRPGHGVYLGGIALEAVDGAHVDNIVASNITMHGARCPVFLRIGNRGRSQAAPVPGSLENIAFSNITARDASLPCIIAGIAERHVDHVLMTGIIIEFGAAKPEHLKKADLKVPECIADYPEPMMFGALPAWGMYCRHADHVDFLGVQLRKASADPRAAIVFDDTNQATFDGRVSWKDDKPGCISAWINDASDLTISRLDGKKQPLFKITGLKSRHVQLPLKKEDAAGQE